MYGLAMTIRERVKRRQTGPWIQAMQAMWCTEQGTHRNPRRELWSVLVYEQDSAEATKPVIRRVTCCRAVSAVDCSQISIDWKR